ncbi:helix-turn-helix domain-containing protein [Acinetobacter baumannii]
MGDIALAVGYKSQSKFGSAFKEIYEMSPLEYRSKH